MLRRFQERPHRPEEMTKISIAEGENGVTLVEDGLYAVGNPQQC
jgi:hypothetical protein